MMSGMITRRALLTGGAAAGGGLALSGCAPITADGNFGDTILETGNWLSYRVHRLIGSNSLAREYSDSELSPVFRTNGNTLPDSVGYQKLAQEGFANWKLRIDGLVEQPKSYGLSELQAMPTRSQITRHDCVEGWSAIGKWTGVQLGRVLDETRPRPNARYVVFHCADRFGAMNYYESIDLIDAYHQQTILAYAMNGDVLPIGHGAPIRLRVERQLGYKHAKYIMRIELAESLLGIGAGKGGYWEDSSGYDWYAGI